jgi:hypothetical protein
MASLTIGHGWHTVRVTVGTRRWPTIRGENPPQGVTYRCLDASYGSRCLQLRLWDWRKGA